MDGNSITAGNSDTGNTSNNEANVSNTTGVTHILVGLTSVGDANYNIANIRNVSGVLFIDAGYAHQGYGNARYNLINFYSGTANEIHGGHSHYGDATNNTVNMFDGNVTLEIGAGYSDYGNVNYNTLNIYGGTVNGTAYGGRASYYGTVSGDAVGNTLNIYGGTFNGDIYGGWAPNGNVRGNILNVYGSPKLENSTLYAGRSSATGESSDNHLNIYTSNITAKNISGFESLNFILPSDATNGTNILTLTDTAGTDLSNTVLNVNASGAANFNTGDTINLITNNSGLTISDLTNSGVLTKGVSMDYDMTLNPITDSNGNVVSMNATLGEVQGDTLKEQTRMIGQTPVSNIQAVTIASEKLMEWLPPVDFETLEEDQDNPPAPPDIVEPKGFEIFMNIGLGRLKTKLGDNSFVKTNGGNYDLGAARHLEQAHGDLHIAPIIQYGRSHYDVDTNDMHGSGNTSFLMGGIIARKTNNSGFYYEGSFRAGRAENDFSSTDFQANGQKFNVGYNASMPVFAGHVKLGNAKRLGRNNLLDVYGIYFYTRQNGTSADLSTGEHYDFSAATSHRIKLGYRLLTRTSKISRIYTEMAFQYEKCSDVSATYANLSTPQAGDKGASGMLQVGWLVKPNKNIPLMLDLNATAWVGHQRGVTAAIKFKRDF